MNHCRALYRFLNKSYDENKTTFRYKSTKLAADAIVLAIVSAIVCQTLFRIL